MCICCVCCVYPSTTEEGPVGQIPNDAYVCERRRGAIPRDAIRQRKGRSAGQGGWLLIFGRALATWDGGVGGGEACVCYKIALVLAERKDRSIHEIF